MQFSEYGQAPLSTVPSLKQSAKSDGWKAAGRALISGYVDSYTLLNFGVYASFMKGNTTSAGSHIGQADLAAAEHSLLPMPFFVLGIFVGTLLVDADRLHRLTRLSVLAAAMLTAGIVAAHFAWPGWVSILVLSTAMGIMNTSITHVGGQSVSLGFATGDLNNLGRHLAMGIRRAPVRQIQGSWDTHWLGAGLLAGIWTAFFWGAVLGAALAARLDIWSLLLPALILGVFAVLDRAAISSVQGNLEMDVLPLHCFIRHWQIQ
jgi:uncharacterized membrane protein YoaK (UPF0700 family)